MTHVAKATCELLTSPLLRDGVLAGNKIDYETFKRI